MENISKIADVILFISWPTSGTLPMMRVRIDYSENGCAQLSARASFIVFEGGYIFRNVGIVSIRPYRNVGYASLSWLIYKGRHERWPAQLESWRSGREKWVFCFFYLYNKLGPLYWPIKLIWRVILDHFVLVLLAGHNLVHLPSCPHWYSRNLRPCTATPTNSIAIVTVLSVPLLLWLWL